VKAAKDRGVKFGRSIWLEIEFDEHVPFFHAVGRWPESFGNN
jgi:hypothetical protein